MAAVRDHRDLRVWQMAMELAPLVYGAIGKLPKTEIYALGDQMRRATVSIPANIAEGRARQHTREFLQFVCVARGSLAELDTLLALALRLGYLNKTELQPLDVKVRALWFALNGLSAALSRRVHANP